VPKGQLSWTGKSRLAPNGVAEDKLAEVTARMSKAERRAFWIGVLLMDGAVTLDDVLRNWEPPAEEEPTPKRRLTVVRDPAAPCVCGRPRAARRPGARGPNPSTCETEECDKGRKALDNRRRYRDRPQAGPEAHADAEATV
jgi:hypothetical protein